LQARKIAHPVYGYAFKTNQPMLGALKKFGRSGTKDMGDSHFLVASRKLAKF